MNLGDLWTNSALLCRQRARDVAGPARTGAGPGDGGGQRDQAGWTENSSMTGLASSSWASSATRARAASSAGSPSSTSNLLPWRTPTTWPNPSRWQALAMASPCGSWISGFSITSTTTLATREAYGTAADRTCAACPARGGYCHSESDSTDDQPPEVPG